MWWSRTTPPRDMARQSLVVHKSPLELLWKALKGKEKTDAAKKMGRAPAPQCVDRRRNCRTYPTLHQPYTLQLETWVDPNGGGLRTLSLDNGEWCGEDGRKWKGVIMDTGEDSRNEIKAGGHGFAAELSIAFKDRVTGGHFNLYGDDVLETLFAFHGAEVLRLDTHANRFSSLRVLNMRRVSAHNVSFDAASSTAACTHSDRCRRRC